MLKVKKTVVLLLLFMLVGLVKAQQDKVEAAYNFLQQDKLDSAKANIDLAFKFPEIKNDAQALYIKSFIYKSIFNKSEKNDIHSPSRLEALRTYKQLLVADTKREFSSEDTKKGINYLINTFYNASVENMDTVRYKTAVEMYNQYREYYPLVDPSKESLDKKDIAFDLALAEVYTSLFRSDTTGKSDFFNLAKERYNKVLLIDSNNVSANYCMGLLFYNKAVDIINKSRYDIDLVALTDIEDKTKNLFMQSLPYMQKAYKLNPKRKETLVGLSGIYYGLNDIEKSTLYKEKLQELENKK